MKPEMILQVDVLDILFDNRNKTYGAYMLRKGYNTRLKLSMIITFSIICMLLLIKMYNDKHGVKKENQIFIPVPQIELVQIEMPDTRIKLKSTQPIVHPKVAQVANPTPVIVPDHLADKPLNPIDKLADKLVGLTNSDGVDGLHLPPIVATGDGGVEGEQGIPAIEESPKEVEPLAIAEEMPEFPGGRSAFQKFMMRHLKHPENLEDGQKIVVKVKFVVDEGGTIKNIEVLQSGGRLDAEVLRVIKKMPTWKPGRQNGRFVPVYFQLPVTFVGIG